ncbi:MAG: PKD domain-containing protein, partial [Bacteroidales bacterium]|nr:PKD domain-containing protein [Bacteroidales bacterium]
LHVIIPLLMSLLIIGACEKDEPIPLPDVKFSADRTIAGDGETILFIDRTQNEPTSWLWSFGDGNTSTDQEPSHVYNSAGTYTVELAATNETGTSSLIKPDYITINLKDERDVNSYKTVEIGNQVWMAENLKYLPVVNQIPDDHSYADPMYYVYNYAGTDVNTAIATEEYLTYGVLYNWPALMNGEQSSDNNPSGVQGVCPAGWHVPSKAEWSEMIGHLGGENVAGGKLKEADVLHWNSPNTGATNETGFTALPGGGVYAYSEDGWFESPEFAFLGVNGVFWSASEFDEKIAWYYHLNSYDEAIDLSNIPNSKGDAFSVRCVQD